MKKGTLLTLLLSLVMGVSSMALVGCGNKDNGDGGDNNNGGSGGNNGGSSVEQPSTPSTPAAPVLLSAATVSNGVKYTYTQTEFKDINGNLATFAELVNTQIDVLAQDILYRLANVYVKTQNIQDSYNLLSGSGVYKFGNNNAIIAKNNILAQLPAEFNYDSETLVSVDLTGDNGALGYQKAIVINNDANILKSQAYLDLRGAIDGYNTKFSADVITGNKSFDKNVSNQWSVVNQISKPAGEDVALTHMMQYKDSLKVKIAQILSGDNNTNYNVLLEKINVLGYNNLHKTQIISAIKNDIIGQALVNKDDEYFEIIKNDYNSLINGSFILAVKNNSNYTNDYSPLFYKGYSIVVPAIVEQALANTFDGTTKTLYPKMSRTAVNVTTAPAGFTTAEQYETFTVMAKQGAKTTKMVLSFQGNGTTVGKTITVAYQIKAGTSSSTATKQVTLNALATDVEFDLNSLLAGKTFGNYSGNTTAYTSNQAGVKADVNAEGQSLEYDNDNYVKFTVSGLNAGEKFVVKLNGIYDKV